MTTPASRSCASSNSKANRVRFRPPSEGRPLGKAAGGVVPAGQVFTYSDFVGSHRFTVFGAVPAAGILGFARPVITGPF